ncbi:hypothetical protein GBAR_LOCUS22688 [Geodia barretti]|uniref:Uncharacterized protein n=1 Tax=Geodia barretti TaxID=519541 RepID=A0AA35T4U0_GEOBA|nr:hypothetical protein GBAR_LOCUS22688 [Geodia barretti]
MECAIPPLETVTALLDILVFVLMKTLMSAGVGAMTAVRLCQHSWNTTATVSVAFSSRCTELEEVEFNGDASLNYAEREGLLNGEVTLQVTSMIAGTRQMFKISSPRSAEAYVHIGNVDPCNNKGYGLSFTASYQPQPGELFFTRLLLFTEITQNCSFSAFLPITSDYRALGLSLHTECPLLAIGHLILPEMSHTITFIGSENPNCFTSNFLEVPDPALVIESELVNDRLPLGNIFELQANSAGPDVVTVFGREDSGPVSQFHSVQVTLFGECLSQRPPSE